MKKIFEFTKQKTDDGFNFVLKINVQKFDEYFHGHPYDYICNQLWLGAKPVILERKIDNDIQYWIGKVNLN